MRKLIYLLMAVVLVSCGASINPEFQKKINDYNAKGKNGSFASTGKFLRPMPLAVGQWVITSTTSDGKRSISKTSIVGAEQDGFVFDMYNMTDYEETATQMLVVGMDKFRKPEEMDNIDIIWVKMKDKDGKISEIDGPVLSMMKGFYKKGFTNFMLNTEGILDGGTVTVPAGTFSGCSKITTEVTYFGSTYTSESWFHPDVPISGMVQSKSKDNDMVTKLIDFGTTGAKKSF
jgi:hypothetical protein